MPYHSRSARKIWIFRICIRTTMCSQLRVSSRTALSMLTFSSVLVKIAKEICPRTLLIDWNLARRRRYHSRLRRTSRILVHLKQSTSSSKIDNRIALPASAVASVRAITNMRKPWALRSAARSSTFLKPVNMKMVAKRTQIQLMSSACRLKS